MNRKPEPKPIEFRQLLALTRDVLLQDPTMPDGEWKERIKRALVMGGWECPRLSGQVSRAMTQVEQSLRKTLGPRPVVLPPQQEVTRSRPQERPTTRTTRPEGWDCVSSLMTKLSRGSARSRVKAATFRPTEVLALSEREALDEFWRAAQTGARLELLRAFAEIALMRQEGWDPASVRAEKTFLRPRVQLSSQEGCFACLGRGIPLHEHHVIQLQHGGSDTARNRVLICEACHGKIHPWLATGSPRKGWASVSEMAASATVQKARESA